MTDTPTNQKYVALYYDSATKSSKRLLSPASTYTGLSPKEKKMCDLQAVQNNSGGSPVLLPPSSSSLLLSNKNQTVQSKDCNSLQMTRDEINQLDNNKKIDLILNSVLNIQSDVTTLRSNQSCMDNKVSSIEKENMQLKLKVAALEGRNVQLENDMESIKERLTNLESSVMKPNFLMHNIPEAKKKEVENPVEKIKEILQSDLGIDPEAIYNHHNPNGFIRIDQAYRMGKKVKNNKPRPILVRCSDYASKEIIMSKVHLLVDNESDIKITSHLPREVRERRAALIPTLIKLRESNDYEKVQLSGDKLITDGKIFDPGLEKNPVNKHSCIPNLFQPTQFKVTTPIVEEKSKFTAYGIRIKNLDEASAALHSLYQFDDYASATHRIYAYSYNQTGSDLPIKGHSDDGEFTAGQKISALMTEMGCTNMLVCVTRHYGNINLGSRRFAIIVEQARKVLEDI